MDYIFKSDTVFFFNDAVNFQIIIIGPASNPFTAFIVCSHQSNVFVTVVAK